MIRIGIEAQRIFRKKKHGMDIVVLETLRRLREQPGPFAYTVFAQPDEDRLALEPSANMTLSTPGPALYPIWEQRHLPQAAAAGGVDLLHCTSNTAPLRCSMPLVVTIHDIIYLEKWMITEGSYYQRLGNLYRRWNVPRIAHRADMVLTVSHYERQRIMEALKLPPDRVRTVYNACGAHFTPATPGMAESLTAFRQKMQLPERFVLFLGNTDPKKNLPNVMRSLGLLLDRGRLDFKLVMPDLGEAALASLLSSVGYPKLRPHIQLTGYIPNTELPNLYRLAELFLYPSLRESFGIPILEAMGCGIPVITSNTSAMPEVAGPGALLIDPTNPEAIAEQILEVLGNQSLRQQTIAYGLNRAAAFSWQKTADEVVEVYQLLTGKQAQRG